MEDLQSLLAISARSHCHLCPRQVLGVRIGLAGLGAQGFCAPARGKRLMVIAETDGCFVDGITAATGCTVGHRTLRVEDYGKIAATFVDTTTGRALRIAPRPDVRQRASLYAPDEPRRYFAQLRAYQIMPAEELIAIREVTLITPVERIISRPGARVNCSLCGEEIINERGMLYNGSPLCRACGGQAYYRPLDSARPNVPLVDEIAIFAPARGG